MLSLDVYSMDREKVSSVDLDEAVFGQEPKLHLLHAAVRYQRAKKRAGTHKVKTRTEVSGGGKKPFKQKGTGRARAGTTRGNIWRGGGVAHGPAPRSYAFKMNKKERRAALRSAVVTRLASEDLVVLDRFDVSTPKTSEVKQFVERFGFGKVLIVVPDVTENIRRASRNLPNVSLLPVEGLNVYDILRHGSLVITTDALGAVSKRLEG